MPTYIVLTMKNARTELGTFTLEKHISDALSLPQSKVTTLMDDEDDDCITIIIYPEQDDIILDADDIASKLNILIQRGDADAWVASREANSEVASDEESVCIEEEEALEIWREMSEEARTGHLDKVPSPDGIMIQPTNNDIQEDTVHNSNTTPSESQLRRDPTLLKFDNVKRVDASQIHNISWNEPIIISNAVPKDIIQNSGILEKHTLASSAVYGEVEVRTGNRETLIDNGITNSKPMQLKAALASSHTGSECGRIVFSPVKELPNELVRELEQFTNCFPSCCIESSPKFTLTLASEGFGIGMHKHKAAMFMLLVGEKKWYMCSSNDLEGDTDTHPGFYQEKSSHKCLQKAGEVLFVPNDWYHEIFNLEYTAGIQALPG